MNAKRQENALRKLEARLQSLKNQNLRIGVLLMHQVKTGAAVPGNMYKQMKFFPRMSHGVTGWRSDVEVQTDEGVFAACAVNSFTSNPQCRIEHVSAAEDFWDIVRHAGKLVSSLKPMLQQRCDVWAMWQEIESPSSYEGLWLDFVFEVAWLPDSFIDAPKNVRWGVWAIALRTVNSVKIGELPPMLPSLLLDAIKPIPYPVPLWYSEIEDIVAASQYALDFLREAIEETGQGSGQFPSRPDGKRSEHRIDSSRATEDDKKIHAWEMKVVSIAGEGGAKKAWDRHKDGLNGIGFNSLTDFRVVYERHRKKLSNANPKMD